MSISFRPAFQRAALSFVLTLSLSCGGGDGGGSTGPTPNPVPTLSGLVRDTITAGGTPFVLTVHGTKFTAGLTGTVDSVERTTSRLNDTTATVTLVAADVAVAGDHQVRVANPEPGGGVSGALPLHVLPAPPVPVLDSLGADTAQVGSPYTLDVYGSSFTPQSVIRSNDTTLPTGHLSSSHLSTTFFSFPGTPGSRQITVFTPAPGGGTSAVKILTVLPDPVITATLPDTIWTGVGTIPFRVVGHDLARVDSVQTSYQGTGASLAPTASSDTTVDFNLDRTGLQAEDLLSIRIHTRFGSSGWRVVAIRNPVPTVTALTPDTVDGTGPTDTILVTGTGFLPGMDVRVDSNYVTTEFIDSAHVRAILDGNVLMTGGTHSVEVYDGSALVASNSKPIVVLDPAPVADSLTGPVADSIGSSARHVLWGTNFRRNGSLLVNGLPVTPDSLYVQSSSIDFNLPTALTSTVDTLSISWENNGPGGGTTVAFHLTIIHANPVPHIDSVTPAILAKDTVNATIALHGTGFVPGASVRLAQVGMNYPWSPVELPAQFINATEIQIGIPDSFVAQAVRLTLLARNPQPTAWWSNADTVSVRSSAVTAIRSMALTVTKMVGDSVRHRAYAAVPSYVAGGPRLVVLDPVSATVVSDLPIDGEVNDLDISIDGSWLYAAIPASKSIRRYDLATLALDQTWTGPKSQSGFALRPLQIAASPSDPNTIAVVTAGDSANGMKNRVVIYDDTVARSQIVDIQAQPADLSFPVDTMLVVMDGMYPASWHMVQVDSAGADSVRNVTSATAFGTVVLVHGDTIITTNGSVSALNNGTQLGTIPGVAFTIGTGGTIYSRASHGVTPAVFELRAISASTLAQLGSTIATTGLFEGDFGPLVRWGPGMFASAGAVGVSFIEIASSGW